MDTLMTHVFFLIQIYPRQIYVTILLVNTYISIYNVSWKTCSICILSIKRFGQWVFM